MNDHYQEKRILVVDDDLTALMLMRATLERSGFVVGLAENGEEALRQFNAQPFDMVMLDIEMPGLNGYQICARLRKEAGDELPIVMVTGMDDLESVDRAFEAGATDFLAKPINWGLIGHRVKCLLRTYGLLQDLYTANAHNSAILNAIPDILLRLDGEGAVLDARLGGQVRGNLQLPKTGYSLAESFTADIATRILDCAARVRASDVPENLDITFGLNAGEEGHYEARLARINVNEILCLIHDISRRKQAEKSIYNLAYFDTLTGLPNRLSFFERLQSEIQRSHKGKLAILFMGLDGFKKINDTLGHGAGDLLLQSVAERLRQGVLTAERIDHNDVGALEIELARLGGDEFTALIFPLQHGDEAGVVARRIHESIRRPFHLISREMLVTSSIGIAIYPDDGEDAPTLIKHADTAMCHAKAQGRDNYQFYNAALTQEAMRRLNLESDLRLALDRGEFSLVYQPQIDLVSGRIHSLEALIRWQHPVQGPISPMDFIPAAEENGLIVPIGDWVLRTACADVARWQAAGQALRVAVNLSAVQFRNPDLVSRIQAILAATAVAPEWLELEVTEGVLMDDSATTLTTLNALRQAGMHLSLDDFGTGYSSLSYLKRMPLTNLKVDQSFVRGLPADKESLAIVRAIVSLAKNLGFTVTAEGVETLEQARILNGLSCETLQGYYFSKPVRAAEIDAMLERRWTFEDPSLTGA
ncbi:MAG: EAL domain-containing protein [Propionivibrio sp.]|uniref:putative bifunctional diguanylate cyclase/phosphodiesterase n=1 Tax=Propionivibrio sp. TaxID=2212460 RepID=UPI001A37A945|nr:EAL domain-containing protein [Propionivibrio sp.]MBL8415755.1 EAL domain-containing protein [Propionivibrio sp.]